MRALQLVDEHRRYLRITRENKVPAVAGRHATSGEICPSFVLRTVQFHLSIISVDVVVLVVVVLLSAAKSIEFLFLLGESLLCLCGSPGFLLSSQIQATFSMLSGGSELSSTMQMSPPMLPVTSTANVTTST